MLTQQEMADLLNVSEIRYRQIETQRRNHVHYRTGRRFVEVLGECIVIQPESAAGASNTAASTRLMERRTA
jgi:hypothetical protein